jgi:hypothetical protein
MHLPQDFGTAAESYQQILLKSENFTSLPTVSLLGSLSTVKGSVYVYNVVHAT